MSDRETEIILFDAFSQALNKLCRDDFVLFSTQKKKGPITHRIAMYIENELDNSAYLCDTQFQIKGEKQTYTPDMIIHDRKGNEAMAIYWQDGYLSSREKEEARDFHKEKKCFTIAFSLLPDKDYFLIYRFAENYTDYLHISREDFSEEVLKRCSSDEDIISDQLLFKLEKKRQRKKKEDESLPAAAEDPALSE